jgi:hypothetical protein
VASIVHSISYVACMITLNKLLLPELTIISMSSDSVVLGVCSTGPNSCMNDHELITSPNSLLVNLSACGCIVDGTGHGSPILYIDIQLVSTKYSVKT